MTDRGRLVGQMVCAKRADVLLLRGWFYGDSRVSGRHGGRAFLVLSDDESAWHAPIVERHPRRDLQRGLLARDRATRRLVRALDRLHPNVARLALHIWAGGRDSFGFELVVRLDTPLSGTYRIGFVDATASGSYLVQTEFVLEVT